MLPWPQRCLGQEADAEKFCSGKEDMTIRAASYQEQQVHKRLHEQLLQTRSICRC